MKKNNILSKALFSIAAMFIATSAIAIPQDPCLANEACCEEAAPGPFAFSYPKDVGLSCPRGFYVHGEYLMMKASEEGLEYALVNNSTSPDSFPLTDGKIHGFSSGSDEWDWRYGFRVGIGFTANTDSWNLSADWTYIKIKSDSDIKMTSNEILPLFFPPVASGNFAINDASSRWSGDYSTFDLMLGKPYHVSRYYISNPNFGIRTGWIDQDYHVRYMWNHNKTNVFLKNDFWGIGPRASYEGQFILSSNWSIYGKAAFALLFGKFDISQQSHEPFSSLAFEYKTEDSFYSVKPNAELGIGVNWSKFFDKNQYNVSLRIGYEFHHWWDQNQLRRFFDRDPTANDTVSRGDLSFNGFMFGAAIDF